MPNIFRLTAAVAGYTKAPTYLPACEVCVAMDDTEERRTVDRQTDGRTDAVQ